MSKATYKDYLSTEQLPHLWCPGCGHGIILRTLLTTLADLSIPREKALLATGIGCSGRSGDYVNFHRFQGTHGRTLAYATGIKLARPELNIICMMGDGDSAAIGISHLIHAARRNIDLTALICNNFNYGMTGGQFSPLTPQCMITSTSGAGSHEPSLDICRLTGKAGANYVARTTVYHLKELQRFLKEAIQRRGFSLVEILTPCPTYFGRYNKLGKAPEMLDWLKDNILSLERYEELKEEEREKYQWRGKLVDRNKPEFIIASAGMEGECRV